MYDDIRMGRIQKFLFPSLALLGVILGVVMVALGLQKPPIPPIQFPPAISPYEHAVAGAGIIESLSENIAIGTPYNEIVEHVHVLPGAHVQRGDPLFTLNTESDRALLKESEERLAVVRVQLEEALRRFSFYERVTLPGAVSEDAFTQSEYEVKQLAKQVKEAEAAIEVIQTRIERSVVRAPLCGVVLQSDVRPGQSAEKNPFNRKALMLFGNLEHWHIRVDIDEDDAWRVLKGGEAVAFVRGNSSIKIPLEFVRIEPYIVPKLALTGDNIERVDTRVLQIIYRFSKDNYPVYVGQILDVFIKALPADFRFNGKKLPDA